MVEHKPTDVKPNCRSCRARLLWAFTEKGRRIPLDPKTVDDGNIQLREGVAVVVGQASPGVLLYKSHFSTCPNAKRHRRRK